MTASVATPPRPDPWATTDPREALRDNNAGRIVSMTPGMTPGPGAAYPANMVDFCGHDENYVPDVKFTGQKAMVLHSLTQHVHNGGSGGVCEPIGHAPQVRAGGSPLIRNGDSFWMDNRKTVGEATFVRDTASYAPTKDGDPIPGSLSGTALAFSGSPPGQVLDAPPVRPAPAPAPRFFEPPPEPPPVISPGGVTRGIAKYGKWGSAVITGAIILLVPTNKATLDDVIPQDDFERGVVKQFDDGVHNGSDSWQMRDWARKEILEHRKQVAQSHEQTRPNPVPVSPNARITGKRGPDPKNPCLLIPYGFLVCPKIKDMNGDDTDDREQSHHVVADRAFRSGARSSTWDQTGYISGMSQGAGLAMCLEGNASNPASDHGIATKIYESETKTAATNGMVPLGTAEAAGAQGIQAATRGRCKASEIQAQLRAYHQSFGMGPDTMVRQSTDPLQAGQSPALGSRASGVSGR